MINKFDWNVTPAEIKTSDINHDELLSQPED
jgi:hypothetical protein